MITGIIVGFGVLGSAVGGMALVYIIGFVVCAFIVAQQQFRNDLYVDENWARMEAVFIGCMAGFIWPFILIAFICGKFLSSDNE